MCEKGVNYTQQFARAHLQIGVKADHGRGLCLRIALRAELVVVVAAVAVAMVVAVLVVVAVVLVVVVVAA